MNAWEYLMGMGVWAYVDGNGSMGICGWEWENGHVWMGMGVCACVDGNGSMRMCGWEWEYGYGKMEWENGHEKMGA